MLGALSSLLSGGVEELVEGAELGFGEVGEEGGGELGDLRLDLFEEPGAGGGELDAEDALVGGVGGALDEAGGFGALEEAGDVGGFGDEAAGDVALGDAAVACALDDAEDVVLGRREAEGAEVLLHAVHEDGGGAGDVEQNFLLQGFEWFGLLDLGLEAGHHKVHSISMRLAADGCV